MTAIAVDKVGQRCLDYNKRVYFSKMGAGELLSGYGTPTRSNTIEMANGKAQIEYVPVANSRATQPGFQTFTNHNSSTEGVREWK